MSSVCTPAIVGRRRFLKGGLAIGAGIIGATMYSSPFAQVSEDGSLVVIAGADIGTFDPYKTNAFKDLAVISAIAQRLTRMSKTQAGGIDGILALNWEPVQPDRWRVALRENVRFHNGNEFNAETAKWCIETFASDAMGKSMTTSVGGVEIVDAHTIEIVTKFPTAVLPLVLNASCDMLDPAWKQGADYSEETLIGTGPARVAEWVKGQYVVLERNPDYWGQAVEFDRYVIRAVSEAATRANAALAKEGDIVRNILSQDTQRFANNADVSIKTVESNRCAHIRFREDTAPFNDKRVRQAFNYAVDIDLIVSQVLKGFGKPVQGQLQGPLARYWQNSVKAYPYDPDKARALLAAAGVPEGFSVKMETSRGRDQGDFEFSSAIAGMLRDVGINVELVVLEPGIYQAKFAGQEPAAPLFYWSSGNIIQDAENSYRDVTYERAGLEVKDPGFLALFETVQRAIEPDARQAATLAATSYLNDYCPVIFGYQLQQTYAVSKRIAWEPRADEYIFLEEIAFV